MRTSKNKINTAGGLASTEYEQAAYTQEHLALEVEPEYDFGDVKVSGRGS